MVVNEVRTLLYEALTAELPYKGGTLEMLRQKTSREAPAPAKIVPSVPEDLSVLTSRLLRIDPAGRPSGSELLRQMSAEVSTKFFPTRSRVSAVSSDIFVGREKELSQMEEASRKVRDRFPATVHVTGRSGMGKTALIRRFLKHVEEQIPDCVILAGRCYEREAVPFNAWDSLIDALSHYWKQLSDSERRYLEPRDILALAQLFPVLRQVDIVPSHDQREPILDSQQLRLRAFTALREVLRRIAQQKMLVLIIDDVQWADSDSVALLKELLNASDPVPLLFLLCYRDESAEAARAQDLADIRTLGAQRTDVFALQVEELTALEAGDLALRLNPDGSEARAKADAIAKESGGMPFFVDALVRYSAYRTTEGGAFTVAEHKGEPEVSLDEFIQVATSSLPDHAKVLLEFVALAGEPLEYELLRRASGIDIDIREALPTLRMGNLVRVLQSVRDSKIETYHDRIREAVVRRITATARQSRYAQLAGALESSGCQDHARLAFYFHWSGDARRAKTYAVSGAERGAGGLAFDRAAQLYRLALDSEKTDEGEGSALRSKLAAALVNAGRGAEAATEYLQASEITKGVETLVLKQRAAEQLLRSGHIDDGLALLYELCRATRVRLARSPRGVLVFLLFRRIQLWRRQLEFKEHGESEIDLQELVRVDICWALGVGWGVVDTVRRSEAQTLLLLLALKAGEPYRISLGLAGEAAYSAFRGQFRRSEQVLSMANALARKVGKPHAIGLSIFCQGMCDWVKGNWEKTSEACQRAQQIYVEQCTGVTWEIDIARIFELASLAWMGRWAEHSERLPTFRREAEGRGDLFAVVSLPLLSYSYMMLLAGDDPLGANREVRDLIRRWSDKGYHVQHFWAMHGEAEIALYGGDVNLAHALVNRDWSALKRSLQLRLPLGAVFAYHLRARCSLAKAAAASGSSFERRSLLREAERDARQIQQREMSCSEPIALLIRAGIAAISQDTELAADLLNRAESGFERASMMIYAAVARRRRGELVSDSQGRTLVSSADAAMATQRIRRPDRISAMISPGF